MEQTASQNNLACMWQSILLTEAQWVGALLFEDVYVLWYVCMCRWLSNCFLIAPLSTGVYVFMCTCAKKPSKRSWRTDRQRAVGIRMHAGSWAVQLVHSVSAESQGGEWERWRKRGEGARGASRADPVEKLHKRRKRTRNKLQGNSIKKGGCQSGLNWLPHPLLCAKFQERLSPRSRVGGD